MKRLYIIGNGFDRAHKLKTTYWNFRCYLKKYAEEFLVEFEKMYGFYPLDFDDYHIFINNPKIIFEQHEKHLYDVLWKSFEQALGQPSEAEIQTICDTAVDSMSHIECGGIEDTLNMYFEEQFRFVKDLQLYLLKWAKQIRLNKVVPLRRSLMNNETDLFLTFNYTPVLERVYMIDLKNICHIHGGTPPYCLEPPIIGHGNYKAIEERIKRVTESKNAFDEGGSSINRAFANFYQWTFKDTEMILRSHLAFFNRIEGIEEIHIIGHSLGKVDMPYFKEILDRADENALWHVYYHSDGEKDVLERKIIDLGIDIEKLRVLSSLYFWDP